MFDPESQLQADPKGEVIFHKRTTPPSRKGLAFASKERLFRKEEEDDTEVQGDSFIYTITMKIAGKGVPTPCRAGMMTPGYRACVMSLCAF